MPEGEESIANLVQRGEIRVGGLRMCLFEITGGFFSIRESLEKSIGPAASTILYQAGVRSGKRFVASASRIGMIRTGRQGLTDCIDVFSQAGFGNFSIVDFDWEIPQMVIECCNPTAFEAYAYQENKSSPIVPVCDYTRGVLAGFIQH
ncbi:MAG: hypothetical protein ACFFDT_10750, partial [Candidatus Hodarchaeota archaeon]